MAESDLTQVPDAGDASLDESPGEGSVGGGSKKGFLSTTLGKVVAVLGALTLLGGVIAVAAFLVITFVFVDAVEEGMDDIQAQIDEQIESSTTDTGTVEASDDAESADDGTVVESQAYAHEDVGVGDLHVWRDIFQPLLTPVIEETLTIDPTSPPTTTGGTTYQADTLYLLDIFSGTSETAAQFYLDGIVYNTTTEFASEDHIVVMEGERLQNTAWRLVQINTTSVELQYGDSTVNLSVGQGVRK